MRYKHGMTGTPEWRAWVHMRERCENPNTGAFHRYGGRGISVCDEWKDFAQFYVDMGPKPSTQHWLERIDNDGDYCPTNCRWATYHEQFRNKSGVHVFTHNGQTLTLAEWGRELGIHENTLRYRVLIKKLPFHEAISCPKYDRIDKGRKHLLGP